MTGRTATAESPPPRLVTLRSGGWLLGVAVGLVLAVVIWRTVVIWQSLSVRVVGDGAHVASYGFDLSTCLVPRAQIVAAGFPKDGLPILAPPTALTVAGVGELTREMRARHQGRFLVDSDAVIGVTIGGQARAYPLRVLTWHEVVNDELDGVPIAVTYNPLCSSAAVLGRRVGGETLTFGVSGLLYNSNLLLYDRRASGAGESLWSQLQFRALAGPAAAKGARLEVLPMAVMRWRDWKAAHPETTVLAPDAALVKVYKRTYGEYFGSQTLRFPVAPLPNGSLPLKTSVIALRPAQRWHAFTWDQVGARANAAGVWETNLDGRTLRFLYRRDPALVGNPAAVWVEPADERPAPPTVYSFWFAWYAMHPDEAGLAR